MAEEVVIRAEGLGKKYTIGHQVERERYVALRDVLTRGARGAWRNAARMARGQAIIAADAVEEFWALKDVSFEVKRGEVLGIIGRNGAGKSTLFKILSRITEPSAGRVTIQGRVASLLEVGTGFHPELTGRENVYLNGAILGMTRAEIKRKFDEIVAFAEVQKFLDTPVKRYSSGMYVRLAFAVAAHLEPEILVVDEVLAVGDAEFQKKCLGKMSEVAGGGRTVLFVSHNMAVIRHLCERAILLRHGRIVCDGVPQLTISSYLSDVVVGNCVNLGNWRDRITTGDACITELRLDDGHEGPTIVFGEDLRICIRTRFTTVVKDPIFGVIIHDSSGEPVSNAQSTHDGLNVSEAAGEFAVEVYFRKLTLYPGRYYLSPYIADSTFRDIDFPRMCAMIDVCPAPGPHGDLRLHENWGKVFIPSKWRVAEVQPDAECQDKPAWNIE
jgi:lipopolysaccharide transport system ATP-binding protein